MKNSHQSFRDDNTFHDVSGVLEACFPMQAPRRTPYRSYFRLCTTFLWRHMPHKLPGSSPLLLRPSSPEDHLRRESAPHGRAVRRRVATPPVVPVKGIRIVAIGYFYATRDVCLYAFRLIFEHFRTLWHCCSDISPRTQSERGCHTRCMYIRTKTSRVRGAAHCIHFETLKNHSRTITQLLL